MGISTMNTLFFITGGGMTSDQAASLEPNGIGRLVSYIRLVERSMGDGEKKVYERELPIIKKLRRVGA